VHAKNLAEESPKEKLHDAVYVQDFEGMRQGTALIYTHHIEDMHQAIMSDDRNKGIVERTTDGKGYSVSMRHERQLALILGDLALEDGDGAVDQRPGAVRPLDLVLRAHFQHAAANVDAALENTPPGGTFETSGVGKALKEESRVRGFIMGTAERTWLERGVSADEAATQKQELVKEVSSNVPMPKADPGVSQALFDYLVEESVKKWFPTDAASGQGQASAGAYFSMRDRFEQLCDEQFRKHITWTSEHSPQVWLEKMNGGKPVSSGDDRIFYTEQGLIKKDLDGSALRAYREWLRDDEYGAGLIMGTIALEADTQYRDGEQQGADAYGMSVVEDKKNEQERDSLAGGQ
jgi:hypothetical protein